MTTFLKVSIIQAIVLVVTIVLYFGSEIFQRRFHSPKRPIDDRVPLIPAFVFPYSLWFPLTFAFPVTLYFYAPTHWVAFQIAWLINLVISVVAYLVYPTTFHRPHLGDSFSERVLLFVYKASFRHVNCAPSFHCSSSMMIGFAALTAPGLPWWARVIFVAVALVILAGTQFTKQHVLLDLLTAIPVAAISLSIGLPLAFSGIGASLS